MKAIVIFSIIALLAGCGGVDEPVCVEGDSTCADVMFVSCIDGAEVWTDCVEFCDDVFPGMPGICEEIGSQAGCTCG